jgi:hypothetical protein
MRLCPADVLHLLQCCGRRGMSIFIHASCPAGHSLWPAGIQRHPQGTGEHRSFASHDTSYPHSPPSNPSLTAWNSQREHTSMTSFTLVSSNHTEASHQCYLLLFQQWRMVDCCPHQRRCSKQKYNEVSGMFRYNGVEHSRQKLLGSHCNSSRLPTPIFSSRTSCSRRRREMLWWVKHMKDGPSCP